MGVLNKIYISPLNSLGDRFYRGGIIFCALIDATAKKIVFADGGRYDSLIKSFNYKVKDTYQVELVHSVGFRLSMDKLVSGMVTYARPQKSKALSKKQTQDPLGPWDTKRVGPSFYFRNLDPKDGQVRITNASKCDVLVASFDPRILADDAEMIVNDLINRNISAERSAEVHTLDELTAMYRDDPHSWIVIVKAGGMVKVKTDGRKVDDVDLHKDELNGWILNQIRERAQREGTYINNRGGGKTDTETVAKGSKVTVLSANVKSKKNNRQMLNLTTSAQEAVAAFAHGLENGPPVLAVALTDKQIDDIARTPLSDINGWKELASASGSDRKYINEVMDNLKLFQKKWEGDKAHKSQHAFLYGIHSGHTVYYNLAL
jgi:translation initiation factor 2-alpha kinase 4